MQKLIPFILLVFFLTSCTVDNGKKTAGSDEKIVIITTIFPLYDFARQIAGDKAEVVLLLPPGVEIHSFEPTPRDLISIKAADLFIFTGEALEPWAAGLVSDQDPEGVVIVDASAGIEFYEEAHEDEEGHEDEDHLDPHIWLDPLLAIQIVRNIAGAIEAVDPGNSELYSANSAAYIDELESLHIEIEAAMSKVKHRTIIYGGHFAFGYFAKRYGLEHISPYAGFSPDSEPTPQRLAELIDKLNDEGTGYIFFEELIDPKVAKIISEETGAELLLLHGIHNLSSDDMSSGSTYLSLMRVNLENLKTGLGYEE